MSKSCSNLCLCQSALNPHVSSCGFLLSGSNLVIAIQRSDSDFLPHINPNNPRCLPHDVHQRSFSFISAHQCDSEVSENRISEHRVLFLVQHDICNLPQYFTNLVDIQHLDLDLGLLLFLLDNFVEGLAWGRSPLCTQRWITAVLLVRFRSSCIGIQIRCFSLHPPPLLRSSESTIKRLPAQPLSAFKAYPIKIPRRTCVPNWCTRPSYFDVG